MALKYFHFPNSTIFHGAVGSFKKYTFKQARDLNNDTIKIKHLKLRLESYYLHGLKKTKDPFISAILTCVGIEVLGQVMLGVDSNGETDKQHTIEIYKMMDSILADNLSSKFKSNYNLGRKFPNSTPDCTNDLHTYSHILRKGLRNTFAHGYRSLGVVLDNNLDRMVLIKETQGLLIVNPKKYRKKFVELFNSMFDKVQSNSEPDWRNEAVKYFELIIK